MLKLFEHKRDIFSETINSSIHSVMMISSHREHILYGIYKLGWTVLTVCRKDVGLFSFFAETTHQFGSNSFNSSIAMFGFPMHWKAKRTIALVRLTHLCYLSIPFVRVGRFPFPAKKNKPPNKIPLPAYFFSLFFSRLLFSIFRPICFPAHWCNTISEFEISLFQISSNAEWMYIPLLSVPGLGAFVQLISKSLTIYYRVYLRKFLSVYFLYWANFPAHDQI